MSAPASHRAVSKATVIVSEAFYAVASARQFLKSARRAQSAEHNGEQLDGPLIFPTVVCAAFAVELGMKAIRLLETGKRAHGHKLLKLFMSLDTTQRSAIERLVTVPTYPRQASGASPTFSDALAEVSDAFEVWRYMHEQSAGRTANVTFLEDLAKACIAVAEGLLKTEPMSTSPHAHN